MKYLEAVFAIKPYSESNADILKALAGEGGFESFTDTADGMKAYIQEENYDQQQVEEALHSFPLEFDFSFSIHPAEDKDWNETWEKEGFEPVFLGKNKEIVVHDILHPVENILSYEILIEPRLAFGTGTHETTGMLLEMLLEEDLDGKSVLDMGCGTGILGIFCCMRNAQSVVGIDIDEWSVRNARENACLNHMENKMSFFKGDSGSLSDKNGVFSLAIANINRNILLRDLPFYASALKEKDAVLYLSGFYVEDAKSLLEKAALYGFHKAEEHTVNNWCALKLCR